MLNELYDASTSLADVGINRKDWHQQYTLVPKPQSPMKSTGKPTFFVFVAGNSQITRIERVVNPGDVADLRKWETANGYSFPYFNIPQLWSISFDPKKNDIDKTFKNDLSKRILSQQRLQQFIDEKVVTAKEWEAKHFSRIDDCLKMLSNKLRAIVGTPPEQLDSIAALIDRVRKLSAQQFYDAIKKKFKECMLADPSSTRLYFDGAFHSKEGKAPDNNVSILLELDDSSSAFEYPVKHSKVRDWINERLLNHEGTTIQKSGQPDVFGKDLAGSDKKYPDVNVSLLGQVKLRAMNSESLCQRRYRTINEKSCVVGSESRMLMKGALEWLTDLERKGKTWDRVSPAAGNKEILLAYPSVLPEDPPNVAIMFSGGLGESVATDNTGRFEDCAQGVTGTLKGLMKQNSNVDFRVFVLRKMDLARTRVASHRRYDAQHLIDCAKNWQRGCCNLPHILIKQFTSNGQSEWCELKTPFPMEIVWTLNTRWSLGGKGTKNNKTAVMPQWSPSSVKALTTDDGISLLLEEGVFLQQVLLRALSAATRNTVGLVLALGQVHAQGLAFASNKPYVRQAVILPSILGLLLFKMNINKEEYMKSHPYLIGRLLSLADQLHYLYCQEVRNNSIPHQLMGNAIMPIALEEPVKALAIYGNRILPYQAWAKTVSGDAAGLARYFLNELGKVCSEFGGACSNTSMSTIPERCTNVDRAQMLIGYLARPEKSDSKTTE